MTLISRLAERLTLDLRRNPAPAPAPKPKVETQAAHYALKTIRERTHAELRQAVGGER
jgi:hypothetical protein